MKREDWVFDEYYDYDLIFDENGKLKHEIVDGKIIYDCGKISEIEVDYEKLLIGNRQYLELGIKPGDSAKILYHNGYLVMPSVSDGWYFCTPYFGFNPTAIMIRYMGHRFRIMNLQKECLNRINDFFIFGDGLKKFFGVYSDEEKLQECIDYHAKKIYDNKLYSAFSAMKALSKEDQQKIINQL